MSPYIMLKLMWRTVASVHEAMRRAHQNPNRRLILPCSRSRTGIKDYLRHTVRNKDWSCADAMRRCAQMSSDAITHATRDSYDLSSLLPPCRSRNRGTLFVPFLCGNIYSEINGRKGSDQPSW